MRRIGQSAVEPVSPGMILALNAAGELASFVLAQQRTAMTADIVEGSDGAVLVARDDDAGSGKVPDEIVARMRDLLRAPGAQPHVEVDCFHLALEPGGISVVALWQRECLRDCELRTRIRVVGLHFCFI